MTKKYDDRLTDEAVQAMREFKQATYNLYVNFDPEVMNNNKPKDLNLWQLHNDLQSWGLVDVNSQPSFEERIAPAIAAGRQEQGETVHPDDIDDEVKIPFLTDDELKELEDIHQQVTYKAIQIDEDLPLLEYVGKIMTSLTYGCEIEIGGSDRHGYSVEDVLRPIESVLRDGEYDFDAYKSVYVDHILLRVYN